MNYNTFKRIKDDPTIRYKSFGYICNGTEYEGWLDELRYRPLTGMATITLIPKNKTIISLPPEPACLAAVSDVIITPGDVDGSVTVDWTESVGGANLWEINITRNGQQYANGLVALTHPIPLTALPPGIYSIIVIPFCDIDTPGSNYGEANFTIEEPTYALTLSALLTTGRQPNNRMQLTATGSIPAVSGFSFKFGQCALNTSGSFAESCKSFPGSPFPTPYATMSFNPGDTVKMVESALTTPGEDFGDLTKVVIYDMVGITPAQITKALGQTWTLEFM